MACLSETGKARLFDDVYYAAESWSEPRRIVMKAEWLPKGPNPRFVLTNLDLPPQVLYDCGGGYIGVSNRDKATILKGLDDYQRGFLNISPRTESKPMTSPDESLKPLVSRDMQLP